MLLNWKDMYTVTLEMNPLPDLSLSPSSQNFLFIYFFDRQTQSFLLYIIGTF